MKISDIISPLEAFAPLSLQENYDNCGLQVGDRSAECTGVLLALDATPEVMAEALARGCNLVVTHHPLLFRGLKHITGATRVEQTVIAAISSGIAIYSLHTAIDNAPGGVSHEMARLLGLREVSTLDPMAGKLLKLVVYVPDDDADRVATALFDAGAGKMGRYDSCSYGSRGQGTFRPLEGSHPYVGRPGHVHYEPETRLEVLVPEWIKPAATAALLKTHPYEHPAYEYIRIDNVAPLYGSGAVGTLESPMSAGELTDLIKATFHSPVVRTTAPPPDLIVKVALCGGSGSFLIDRAISAGAEAIITSDTSYHNFVDYTGRIFICDIGHYESEYCVKKIFYNIIRKKFPTFAVEMAQTDVNPIHYL